MGKLYFIEIDESINKNIFNKLLLLTSEEKQKKINKFRFDVDKSLSLYPDILVRFLACKELNISNDALQFGINKYGKPYLTNYPDFYYNISHTRNAIIVGISNKEIGVDVERIKAFDSKIAERFFSVNEINYIRSISSNQDVRFYEIWTKKEAYTKWIGKGLSVSLKSFDVTSDELSQKISTFENYGYICSICCIDKINTNDIIHLSEHHLFEMTVILNKD